MPFWVLSILGFLGKRSLHFIVYGVIGLICWGIYRKIFVDPTNRTSTKIERIDKQVNVYQSNKIDLIPLIGCSAWRARAEINWEKKPNHSSSSTPSSGGK